jgi:Ca2+-binding EF-hand superfamily protein
MDTTKKGYIELKEISLALKKVGLPMTDSQIKNTIIKTMDLDKDNKISFEEFIFYSENRKEQLQEVFFQLLELRKNKTK